MKHLIISAIFMIFTASLLNAQDTDCEKNQARYQQLMKQKQYDAAYPLWKKQMTDCPSFIVNVYNHAEIILPPLIASSTGAQKDQYINDLIGSYDQRFKYFPQDKNMLEGDKISYELEYGKIDSVTAYNQLKGVIQNAMQNNTKLTYNTISSFFADAINLYYYKKLSDPEYINAYDLTHKAIELNIDIRNTEKAPIEDKLYADPPQKLTSRETQIYKIDTASISYLQNIDTVYAQKFNQYLEMNCYNLGRIVEDGFAANQDNKDWVAQYYWLMNDQNCDSPAFAKIEERVKVLFPPGSSPASGGSSAGTQLSPTLVDAYGLMKKGNYSGAIDKFKKALDETSNNNAKAGIAVNIANCYVSLGSYSNAITWGNKALGYKPGYASAYKIMAYAYYKGAGQLPGTSVQQRQAGWLAADYARRGGDNKAAAQYDRSAPSKEECFLNGITVGSTVKLGGWIGKTTTARCVPR